MGKCSTSTRITLPRTIGAGPDLPQRPSFESLSRRLCYTAELTHLKPPRAPITNGRVLIAALEFLGLFISSLLVRWLRPPGRRNDELDVIVFGPNDKGQQPCSIRAFVRAGWRGGEERAQKYSKQVTYLRVTPGRIM